MGRSRTAFVVSLAAVTAMWLAARVAFFNGYYTEDAPGYVGDAISIAAGDYQVRHHVNGLNVGTYAPVALPLLMLGKSEVALSLWPLFCSLLGVASLTGLAAVLFGRPFGVLTAFLYATFPGDVFFSTVVMPDAIQSGWLCFSLFLVVLAGTAAPRHSSRLLAAAGAAMGVCHLIRANGAILLPVGLAAIASLSMFLDGRAERSARERLLLTVRRSVVYLAGWGGVFGAEALIYWWAVDDPLFRLHVVDRHYGSLESIQLWGLNTHRLTIPYSAFAPLLWRDLGGWGSLNQDQAYHGLMFVWGLVALLFGGVVFALAPRRLSPRVRAGLAMAAVWFAWPLLYHQFGSQSLTHYVPIHRLSRHLVVYAPGAIVATVAGCSAIWSVAHQRPVRLLLGTVGVAVLLLHLHFNLRGEAIAYEAYHRIKDTYSRIRDRLPARTVVIVADPGDLGFFDFWLNPIGEPRVKLLAFAGFRDCAQLTEGVVLTHSNPGWHGLSAPVIQQTVARLPCLLNPPIGWRLLYQGFPEKVYAIERPDSAPRVVP